MYKITNNTNSPYDLQSEDGAVRLPAFGSIEGSFSGEYLTLLEASQAVLIESVDPEDSVTIDDMRDEYLFLTGESADGRWSAKRLASELAELKEA